MTADSPSEKDRVVIFDTTLRDGEQSPGATMTPRKRSSKSPKTADEMGVDIIEAGFPIASKAISRPCTRSPSDQERGGVRAVARRPEGPRPLRRGDQAGQARRIHTFISTSPVQHEVEAADAARAGPTRW